MHNIESTTLRAVCTFAGLIVWLMVEKEAPRLSRVGYVMFCAGTVSLLVAL